MNLRTAVVTSAVLTGVIPAFATAQDNGDSATLNIPYEFTRGDMAALMLAEVLKSRNFDDEDAVVTYDRDKGVISVQIFGNPRGYASRTDRARQVLGEYWGWIQAWFLGYADRRLDVKLRAEDFRIMYQDRENANDVVLAFEGGRYVIP